MLTIAVTGGIGAGKSTVASMLAERGAIVIDSDRLARDVLAPGSDGLAAVVNAFGDRVRNADGSLDRAALAGIVFDPDSGDEPRRVLEEITHPRVRAEFRRLRNEAVRHDPDAVIVNDIPILRDAAEAERYDIVLGVTAADDVRVARLVRRGLDRADAAQRIAAQIGDDERRAFVDVWIRNDGEQDALAGEVDAFWRQHVAERLSPGRAPI